MLKEPKSLIFDFDGLILDTAPPPEFGTLQHIYANMGRDYPLCGRCNAPQALAGIIFVGITQAECPRGAGGYF